MSEASMSIEEFVALPVLETDPFGRISARIEGAEYWVYAGQRWEVVEVDGVKHREAVR
jgi:hypothetical protein